MRLLGVSLQSQEALIMLLSPYSTSPVEGNINKLKRQMYGRATLDLLAAKFIRAV